MGDFLPTPMEFPERTNSSLGTLPSRFFRCRGCFPACGPTTHRRKDHGRAPPSLARVQDGTYRASQSRLVARLAGGVDRVQREQSVEGGPIRCLAGLGRGGWIETRRARVVEGGLESRGCGRWVANGHFVRTGIQS